MSLSGREKHDRLQAGIHHPLDFHRQGSTLRPLALRLRGISRDIHHRGAILRVDLQVGRHQDCHQDIEGHCHPCMAVHLMTP